MIPIQEWGSDRAGSFFVLGQEEAEELQVPERIYYTQTDRTFQINLGSRGRLGGIHILRPESGRTRNFYLLVAAAAGVCAVTLAVIAWLCIGRQGNNTGEKPHEDNN